MRQTPRNSQDESNDTFESSQNSQDSQNSKSKVKNYSAEESAAKYHTVISKNSNRDKDKQEKQQAWEKIKSEFDQYCKSQGIYVSRV